MLPTPLEVVWRWYLNYHVDRLDIRPVFGRGYLAKVCGGG